MNTESLNNLFAFVSRFAPVWEAFSYEMQSRNLAPILTAFSFEQSQGSYVLTDNAGSVYKFRLFGEKIVAISSGAFTLVAHENGFLLL